MHRLYGKAATSSQVAVGSAIEVHRLKGLGLMESPLSLCAGIATRNSPRAVARRDSVLDCGSPLPLFLT